MEVVDFSGFVVDPVFAGAGAVPFVLQVKEKVGSLRFYRRIEGISDRQRERIAQHVETALEKSEITCIVCGASGAKRQRSVEAVRDYYASRLR